MVLDTIEMLFATLPDSFMLRSELRRLFGWLKEKGVTAIITGERGEKTLTRQGLEEYVADCVILLEHRVNAQISTRRLRIVKYRGAAHSTNECPYLIDKNGMTILPITSPGMEHPMSDEFVSTGIPRLDTMLGGKGCFRGSIMLVSGTAGCGKTSVAAIFTDAACRRGERALYFTFEESPYQIIRNMRSIGLDIRHWIEKGLFKFVASRPSFSGLEMYLSLMENAIRAFKPDIVVVDPINSFVGIHYYNNKKMSDIFISNLSE